jgi:AraC family transcriptional regulator of adaptative response/methylated-DNA-[protein]-cysteine methyltransferase
MWSTLPEKKTPSKLPMTLHYAIAKTTLDYLLVATLGSQVRFVALGPSPDRLTSTMKDAFPSATFTNGSSSSVRLAERLAAHVEDPLESISQLPTGQVGTAFQQQVWRAISAIPPGSTRTYAQLAEDVGRPKAVRAVAQACGRNDLALIVPCHRVVGSDGSMTGYRWGAERKRVLLERERRALRDAQNDSV